MLRSVSMVATRRASVASSRVGVRSLGGYVQPPLSQGKGGKDGVIPTDEDQATGREREELKAFAKGQEYFNRQPIKAAKGQGTFQNPIMIPSQESSRIVGQVPKGQDGPIWFEVTNEGVHYCPDLGLHYKLYNPMKA